MGSVLRRPRLGEGRRRLAEPLGRCPVAGLSEHSSKDSRRA